MLTFIDSVELHVKAGKGGDGIVAFLHEKYMEKGGPSGGNGGRGGSIIFVGESGLTTLLDFRYIRKIIAESGEIGGQKNMAGHSGDDVYYKVPIGTTIINKETDKVIGDITKAGQQVIVAKGGRGGKGNAAFMTSRNTAPQFCEKGVPGEEFDIKLDLKVLADVGLVGFPSVGKSTLISMVSAARPKIAEYHFTTLHPNLGVVGVPDGRSFIMADLPGLIEGAHLGLGLGIEFLKHIERTRVIVHIIDMSGCENRDPIEDYKTIRNELISFDKKLENRPEIVVANKMDLPSSNENLELFKKAYPDKEIIAISAATKENLDQLLYRIADVLEVARKSQQVEEESEEEVQYIFKPKDKGFTVTKGDDGLLHVEGPSVKQLFDKMDFNNEGNVRIFAKKLRELGVDDELRKHGAQHGDTIILLNYAFEFFD
jgi:GTP-binding protein